MTTVYLIIFGSAAAFGLSAVLGLVWAARHDQLGGFAAGARSIFDDEEPVGRPTDAFPGTGGER